MVTRRAQCLCGQLSAVCSGEPVRISVCHCLDCKRRTGSVFSYNVRFAQADVSIEGRAKQFTRTGDEGGRVIYNFCPECGAAVHYRIDTQPGVIAIPVGAFADPSFPPPFQSFYHESRRCEWVEINAEPLATFD
ncbi:MULTISPECIES: GFA family protein [unclassified Mesorhizobium]|uniref:GFA family protein n=1 Tax=unclassified Mesorhizobium TaxID=325217 RepID=UPI0003CE4A2C|nr:MULTISPECIES: GFA family protein [unclassified Mesorhizobium]ESX25150.1 aldehyde-activating protein [Mesorhizobium sp. LSHC440B00]ESX36421.1 aldehyde-activating protein [Mesorhizobium sp. LSHC432A00]ESX38187.1 aldehyde-activating protein [Mesorhizobium sp. LSHC440A00]WJI56512.1 GFA family protein [Mesorhizobium sp. C432A]